MTKTPIWTQARLLVLAALTGGGAAGGFYVADKEIEAARRDEYVQAVAADTSTTQAVKIAMVLARYHESSGKHIGTPYIDKAGKGQPLTVCGGITGSEVVAGRYYTPAECYGLERSRYTQAEIETERLLNNWHTYSPLTKATFIDFTWNKGSGALTTSTMRTLANAGKLQAACNQMPRWNRGTVKGVSVVLDGLQLRGDSNAELCLAGA